MSYVENRGNRVEDECYFTFSASQKKILSIQDKSLERSTKQPLRKSKNPKQNALKKTVLDFFFRKIRKMVLYGSTECRMEVRRAV